nr:hypothetical protein [Allomuricauda sp.]
MNRLLILYGCVLIGSTAIAEELQSTTTVALTNLEVTSAGTFENNTSVLTLDAESNEGKKSFDEKIHEDSHILNPNEIEFVEEDEEIVLGFDPYDYLPENFDPYKTYVNFEAIPYIEGEDEEALGFDTAQYLPQGFDPYFAELHLGSLNFIEEEDYSLGFDTANYLPKGFSPYEVFFDIDSIIYIEEEDGLDIELFFSAPNTSENTLELYK